MKCAICNIETHGNDVRWGPEFAHELCIEIYQRGVNVGKNWGAEVCDKRAEKCAAKADATDDEDGRIEETTLAALRSNAGLGLLDRISAHLRQLAPHQKERDGVKLLTEARDELARLSRPRGPAHSCDIPGCAVCDPTYGL